MKVIFKYWKLLSLFVPLSIWVGYRFLQPGWVPGVPIPPRVEEKMYFPKFRKVGSGLYLLSAFYEKDAIRILGVSSLVKYPKISCILLTPDDRVIDKVSGSIANFTTFQVTQRKDLYQPHWILCPIPKNLERFHDGISSVVVKTETQSNTVAKQTNTVSFIVQYPISTTSTRYKMGMCIQPLFNYEDPVGLLEWIEFHKLLGADHFTFYNISIGPITTKLLNSYHNDITVIPWRLPFPTSMIKYYGQILQMNDCMYRYRGRAEFVGFVDVDEFIVPGSKQLAEFSSVNKLFQDIFNKVGNITIAAINFSAVFSFSHFPISPNIFSANKSTIPHTHSKMMADIAKNLQILTRHDFASSWQFLYKSKQVLKPELVQEIEVHWPVVLRPKSVVVNVPEEEVNFIHFRTCSAKYIDDYCAINCTNCTDMEYREDSSIAERFGDDLLFNVANKIQSLGLDALN